ncbi:hypothetical protein LSUCC0031_04675 [Rhodobacterales bacterium LSUCC0031]|nr:hypothetical protein [Rhodobacterales bacterium LSUCC0031]
MPTVTVLAPDSALAMDEVIRQLGENAYIVATNARDGQVEILATNEPAQLQPQRKRATTVSFADAISERLAQATEAGFQTKGDDRVAPIFTTKRAADGIEDLEVSAPFVDDAAHPEIDTLHGEGLSRVVPLIAHTSTATEGDQLTERSDGQILARRRIAPTAQSAQHMHEAPIPPVAGPASQDDEDLRPLLRDLSTQLARLEERMRPAPQMAPTMAPLADPLATAGFSDKIITRLAPTFGASDRAQAFAAALTQKLVAPDPLASLSTRLLVVIGASGVGKSTLAGKIAALTRATEPTRDIALISLTETPGFARMPLAAHAQALSVGHGHLHANQLEAAHFVTPDTTHILDSNLDPETLVRTLGPLRDQMAQGELVVILAIPAGASLARLGGELQKYHSLAPVVALTKLDEYELSAQEASQIAEAGTQIAWLSGTRDLNETLAPVTEEMINEFLTGLLAGQP